MPAAADPSCGKKGFVPMKDSGVGAECHRSDPARLESKAGIASRELRCRAPLTESPGRQAASRSNQVG